MATQTQEELLTDINAKLLALGESVSDTRLKAMVEGILGAQLGTDWQRKMRFPAGANRLEGSKYARLGLGPSDIEFMHQLLTAAKAARLSRGPSEMLTNALRDVSPAFYGPVDDKPTGGQRAMDTAESGYGSQLIGAQYVGELWEAARKASIVFGLLDAFEMAHPTAYLPVEVDVPEMLFVGESTASDSAQYTTSKTGSQRVSTSAKKFVIHQMWSGEMEEDSIIPYVPFLRRQAELSLGHYSDSVVLNGDDTNAGTENINLVDANPADTKHYLAFDGILHAALVDNTGNATSQANAAPSLDALLSLRKLMIDRTYLHDWGHPARPEDLVYICDPETADALAKNEDDLRTVDKYGAAAVVLTGEVAKVGRHSLLSSIAMGLTNTAGKVSTTAGNNLYGRTVAFNKQAFKVGWRRRIQVEMEREIKTDQNRIVYSMRLGFGRFTPTGAASGIEGAAVLYYIAI